MSETSSQKNSKYALSSFISGMMAGIVGKSILHPIDTVKAKL
jgi:hypothetical protein